MLVVQRLQNIKLIICYQAGDLDLFRTLTGARVQDDEVLVET